ncbi:glycoside hydrolase family 43 protein [Streptomyces kunmingensis]|uniref:Glycoside hydrolase family 43 protein n=1 Tax=Streptomyces kunmingensis TaxID=68225 RepID=A0ABU6CSB5_9ACTN|nr:glycoside hydrolase family 43 protein [Streptomyces kunmingensis]MEB3967131.1 glycoside hydrolase family 43 protein [Streptomyces kunmingensis]
MRIFRRSFGLGAVALAGALAVPLSLSLPDTARGAAPAQAEAAQGAIGLKGADPSVLRVGSTYIAVKSADGGIVVRQASSLDGLASAPAKKVWSDTGDLGEVWAPEIVRDGGRYYIYFSAGRSAAHRMYVISSAASDSGYTAAKKLALPDDKWAIDGMLFTFQGQRWFVWSGWAGDTNVEQNLYVARMSDPLTPTGKRSVISQPRESWERVVGNPYINEAPEAIKDPNGQLHIVYSANGSWSSQYCLADLRLRAGGDPTYVWDWYKSNGCLFGSHRETMMSGWDPTLYVDGPGHHSFVLLDGDINTSPPAGNKFPSMFHAVAKGTPYSWENRQWYSGSFVWWGNTTYKRANVPGAETNTGWSLKFFE